MPLASRESACWEHPVYATLLFGLRLDVVTGHTQRLHVVIDVEATFGQRHDVIANRGRGDAAVPFTVDTERLITKQPLA